MLAKDSPLIGRRKGEEGGRSHGGTYSRLVLETLDVSRFLRLSVATKIISSPEMMHRFWLFLD
jgi:hypothetical protein